MDHQMTGQSNFMDSQGNQMMPPGPPQQMQHPFGYTNYNQGMPQDNQQQNSPMIRKMSSHNGIQQMQDNQEVHFMHQNVNGYGNQPAAPQRTISAAGCGYDNINQRDQSMAWRKMSLAPNIRMNSTYGSEFDSPPKQRTQSQAAEYAKRKASLRQFSSQLRVPKITGVANPMLSLTRYTPPPMLSPMRNGVGLFCKLGRKQCRFIFVYLSILKMSHKEAIAEIHLIFLGNLKHFLSEKIGKSDFNFCEKILKLFFLQKLSKKVFIFLIEILKRYIHEIFLFLSKKIQSYLTDLGVYSYF